MIVPSNILRGGNKGSIYLNGNCSVYMDATVLASETNTLTFSFWAKYDPSANRTFIGTGNQSQIAGFIWIYYSINNVIVYQVATGSVVSQRLSNSLNAINKNIWNHYVISCNYVTGRVKFFINGEYFSITTAVNSIFPNRLNRLNIGRYNLTHATTPNTYFSDFKIYSRELTNAEIKLLYKGVNISNNSLFGRWNFNELDGFTAHDSSGNNLHGNITALGTWSNDKPF